MREYCVSVVIPVYNAEQYIAECLQSIVNQSMEAVEIIVVNDGSKDGSKKICESFAKKYDNIVFVDKANEGVSVARNTGLELAKGKYVTFVDADDYIENTYCADMYNAAEKDNSDIVICDYKVADGEEACAFAPDMADVTAYKKELTIRTLYAGLGKSVAGAGVTWGKMYRTQFVKKNNVRFVPGLVRAQDTVFFLELLKRTDDISHISKAMYYYRVNDTSICSGNKYIPDSEEKFGKLLKEYKRLIVDEGFAGEYLDAYYARIIQVIFWHYAHNCFNKQNPKSLLGKCKAYCKILESEPYRTALLKVDDKMLSRRERMLVGYYRAHFVLIYVFVLSFYREFVKLRNKRRKSNG